MTDEGVVASRNGTGPEGTTHVSPEGTTHVSPEHSSLIMTTVGRQLNSATGMYLFATSMALPLGIVSTIITVQYLSPAQFGQLGLLMVLASFLTVLYNVGLLHGTFLWVYGSSGDGGDDVDFDGVERASVAGQRTAMGTGLILTLIVVTCGTIVCFLLAKPLAALLLGSSRRANLVGLAALSGGAGSIFRLTVNVFRFERRPRAFAIATIARPVTVLIASTGLVMAGYGVWGAVLGTALPTIACAIGCMLGAHRSYALRMTAEDARQIALRGATVVVPVIAMFVLHSGDIYLLAPFVSASQLGVYRLASRLGSPPSYFASAFIMTWGPLERSSLVAAAFKVRGQHHVRSLVMTYYMLVGLSIVVLFVAFSRLLVLIAPASYAEAAKVVPLIALAYVMFGAYIILLRTTRPDRMMLWYGISSCCALALYVAAALVLIPAVGVYGAPLANIAGMILASAIVIWRNARNEEPVPVDYRRMSLGFLVAGAVSATLLLGMQAGHVGSAVVTLVALAAYVPALVLVGAIPGSHLPLLKRMVPFGRPPDPIKLSPTALPGAEQDALSRDRAGTLHGSDSNVEYARLTRALRRIGGIGQPSSHDSRIGMYLASREPEAVRDYQMHALISDGVDPFELYRLDRLAKAARKRRFGRATRPPRSRMPHRAARTLDARTRAQLAELLTPINAKREPPGALADTPALGLVRALRLLRRSSGIGAPTATDLTIARAIWDEDDHELSSWQRTELRALKRVARVASRATRGGPS